MESWEDLFQGLTRFGPCSENIDHKPGSKWVSRGGGQTLFCNRRMSNAALANAALVLNSKNWKNTQDRDKANHVLAMMGVASKNQSKQPRPCVFTLVPCGNGCRFNESTFYFRWCTHHQKSNEQKCKYLGGVC